MSDLTKAQKKNAARSRRRQQQAPAKKEQAIQNTERIRRANFVIKWHLKLWQFVKATAFMNNHKRRKLSALIRNGCTGKFDNWFKNGAAYVLYSIGGFLQLTGKTESNFVSISSIVTYEFYDEFIGHFVLTKSGSFYELGEPAEIFDGTKISLEEHKKMDFQMFCSENEWIPSHSLFSRGANA